MGTISDIANRIKYIKSSIVTALAEKGVTSSRRFKNFASEIESMPTGDGLLTEDAKKILEKIKRCEANNQPLNFREMDIENLYNVSELNSMTDMSRLCYSCNNLKSISYIDTSNVTNMWGMFLNCTSLTSVPQLDTSNVTNMNSMFNSCSSLTSIPELNTSNVTSMDSMFRYCSSLKSIPMLDTSNVKDMDYMFEGCESLTSIPQLDTSNATEMRDMFKNCSNIKTIPLLDVRKVQSVDAMFQNCTSLVSIPRLNFINIRYAFGAFRNCTSLETIDIYNIGCGLGLSSCRKLSTAEIEKIFSNCLSPVYYWDINNRTIYLPDTEQARAANKSIVENKGWIVEYATH